MTKTGNGNDSMMGVMGGSELMDVNDESAGNNMNRPLTLLGKKRPRCEVNIDMIDDYGLFHRGVDVFKRDKRTDIDLGAAEECACGNQWNQGDPCLHVMKNLPDEILANILTLHALRTGSSASSRVCKRFGRLTRRKEYYIALYRSCFYASHMFKDFNSEEKYYQLLGSLVRSRDVQKMAWLMDCIVESARQGNIAYSGMEEEYICSLVEMLSPYELSNIGILENLLRTQGHFMRSCSFKDFFLRAVGASWCRTGSPLFLAMTLSAGIGVAQPDEEQGPLTLLDLSDGIRYLPQGKAELASCFSPYKLAFRNEGQPCLQGFFKTSSNIESFQVFCTHFDLKTAAYSSFLFLLNIWDEYILNQVRPKVYELWEACVDHIKASEGRNWHDVAVSGFLHCQMGIVDNAFDKQEVISNRGHIIARYWQDLRQLFEIYKGKNLQISSEMLKERSLTVEHRYIKFHYEWVGHFFQKLLLQVEEFENADAVRFLREVVGVTNDIDFGIDFDYFVLIQ
eukprot:Nk52_evm35s156 gene=Nk52_evmTU35s156